MNSEFKIKALQEFLSRYSCFVEKNQTLRLKEFKNDFKRLKSGVVIIDRLQSEISRLSPKGFNIFDVLGVSHLEVKTHSAFLAELLDPNGSHGQGMLFLESFLKTCRGFKSYHNNEPFPLRLKDVNDRWWFVDREKSIKFGNLDIVVSNCSSKQLLVIENKIYAQDQEDQIFRYSEWIMSKSISYDHAALLYLTLDGISSKSDKKADYFIIGYKKDIKKWLEVTVVGIPAPQVAEIIKQYVDLLGRL